MSGPSDAPNPHVFPNTAIVRICMRVGHYIKPCRVDRRTRTFIIMSLRSPTSRMWASKSRRMPYTTKHGFFGTMCFACKFRLFLSSEGVSISSLSVPPSPERSPDDGENQGLSPISSVGARTSDLSGCKEHRSYFYSLYLPDDLFASLLGFLIHTIIRLDMGKLNFSSLVA